MSDLIRDAPIGQLIRYFTNNRILQYPEERPDYQCPGCYASTEHNANVNTPASESVFTTPSPLESDKIDLEKADAAKDDQESREPSQRQDSLQQGQMEDEKDALHLKRTLTDSESRGTSYHHTRTLSPISSRVALEQSTTRADLEAAFSASIATEKLPTRPIVPDKLADGTVLVDWYTTDDQANPQNWVFLKKAFVATQIYLYTLAVYMGSSIYAPSEGGVVERFGVSATAASLGLALYVLAYGIGPLLFSPLSEIPSIGRNPPYIISFAIFTILCVPTALVDNFAGLLVLRFLQGFFGSPCLATGAATLQDIFSLIKLPYALLLWAFAACCGPAMGPIISGFSVSAENWRWSLWEMLWIAGPIWILMVIAMPETNPSNILLRRARRLRNITGDDNLKAQSELDQAALTWREVAQEALVRPMMLIILDPSIAYVDLYIALCYAIFYSFFEAFPLVYVDKYGFNLGETGLAFISIMAGVLISMGTYGSYLHYVMEPEIRAHGLGAPERRLVPALYATPLIPAGLFIFAWTSDGSIHWVVSCIGTATFMVGLFTLFQCVFVYLALTYPQYSASLFAGNDFARSVLAAAAILFSRPLFVNLGVGPGESLLGALTAAMIAGIWILFLYGDKLRARSKFAAK